MNITSKRIQKLLEDNNISQRELAENVQVTEVTISRYVNGHREPKMHIIDKIAQVFDVSTDYLLGRVNDPQNKIISNKDIPHELSQYVDYIEVLKQYSPEDISLEDYKDALEYAKKINSRR